MIDPLKSPVDSSREILSKYSIKEFEYKVKHMKTISKINRIHVKYWFQNKKGFDGKKIVVDITVCLLHNDTRRFGLGFINSMLGMSLESILHTHTI